MKRRGGFLYANICQIYGTLPLAPSEIRRDWSVLLLPDFDQLGPASSPPPPPCSSSSSSSSSLPLLPGAVVMAAGVRFGRGTNLKMSPRKNEAANKSQFANGIQPRLLLPYSFPEENTVIIFIIYCFTYVFYHLYCINFYNWLIVYTLYKKKHLNIVIAAPGKVNCNTSRHLLFPPVFNWLGLCIA